LASFDVNDRSAFDNLDMIDKTHLLVLAARRRRRRPEHLLYPRPPYGMRPAGAPANRLIANRRAVLG
jgi:hypothetical protein